MELDALREMARAEIEEAIVRFWARAGDLPTVNEVFAAELATWLSDWAESFLVAEEPEETDEVRAFEARIASCCSSSGRSEASGCGSVGSSGHASRSRTGSARRAP